MPAIGRISEKFFTSLITRLGIKPPFSNGFEMSNVVTPVSIVDQDISLSTVQSPGPLLDLPFTNGDFTAPPIGTILADTGPQSAGEYFLRLQIGTDGAQNNPVFVEFARRDAADSADLWKAFIPFGSGTMITVPFDIVARVRLNINERLLVRVGPTAWPAFMIGRANLWLTTL